MISVNELTRRHSLLRKAMEDQGYAALVFVGDSYAGHKGSLRYVLGHNLTYRRSYAVLPHEGTPTLVIPNDAAVYEVDVPIKTDILLSGYTHSYLGPPATTGVVDLLRDLDLNEDGARIGLVHAKEIMRAGDYEVIREAFPAGLFGDASELFERIRNRKSKEEIEHASNSNLIAEEVLRAVEEHLAPGKREREVGAEAYRAACANGTTDTLYLVWRGQDGACGSPAHLPTGDYVFQRGDVVCFSAEVDNPAGYWVQLARVYCLGQPSNQALEQIKAVIEGHHLAQEMLKPGISGRQIFTGIKDVAAKRGFGVAHSVQGHSIGQDIVERPYISDQEDWELAEDMTVAIHPVVASADEGTAFIANTYVVSASGGKALSETSLEPRIL